jgi:hypothetical protein
MKPMEFEASYCSRCSHYTPEGRRGGHCGQLNVPVRGKWKACSLAVPVFLTPLSQLQPLEILPKPLDIYLPESRFEPIEPPLVEEKAALQISTSSIEY